MHMCGSQAMPSIGGDQMSGYARRATGKTGSAPGRWAAIQRKRPASIYHAHIQTIHILRSLRFIVVRSVQTGIAVRSVQHECSQAMPEKCGQQLWHQYKANG